MEVFYWVSIGFAWVLTALNVRDMWRRRRKERKPDLSGVAEWTGLSELQVQVALDEGTAAFFERLDQLKPTKKEDS